MRKKISAEEKRKRKQEYEKKYHKTEKYKKWHNKYERQYLQDQEHKAKHKARTKTNYLLKHGYIAKPHKCIYCKQQITQDQLQMHHFYYYGSKAGYCVVPVCHACHIQQTFKKQKKKIEKTVSKIDLHICKTEHKNKRKKRK